MLTNRTGVTTPTDWINAATTAGHTTFDPYPRRTSADPPSSACGDL
jgi:hypothetical protein